MSDTLTLIGDGGHAAAIRDLISIRERLDANFEASGKVIAVGNNRDREREAKAHKGAEFPYLVHPSATFASSALLGMGTVVMAGAIVQARACIGEHCIVNTAAVVEHDCVLGDFVHIAPGAILCGGVHVGKGSFIGAGATVIQSIKIGSNVTVGAGATVVNDIPDGVTVTGTPARSR